MRLLLWCCCWCCVVAPEAFAQTTRHPQKVEIKPATPSADALRIWGGLQAGPDGSIQVINADGTISGSSGIADGSLTFAKWAQNGCALSDVPTWDGAAWVCGAGGTGIGSGDDITVTGNWRFSTNTLFGDATTPQQLIHIYKSGSAAGLRIEDGSAAWWDLTATGSALTLGSSGGTVGTWTATGLGILKTPATALDVDGTATVTGLNVNGLVGSHLIPDLPDTYDLGSSEKPWRQSFISQINAVIFAEQTATLLGGYTIIAKDAGSFASRVDSSDIQVDFGKALTPGSFVLVRAHDEAGTVRAEYLEVGALQSGTIYAVTRDLAGVSSPDPDWPEGTPFMVLGSLGDGRIELNAYSTPKISFVTQGGSYNAQTEQLRLGALDGMPGMPAGKFGLYVGDTSTAGMAFFDSTLLVRGQIQATSGWFGNSSSQGVQVDFSGLSVSSAGAIRSASTTYSTGTGFFLGADAGDYKFRVGSTTEYVRWTGSALEVLGSITASTGAIGGWTITSDRLASTNIRLISGADPNARLEVGDGTTTNTFGIKTTASASEIAMWGGATHTNRASAPFRVTSGGALTATNATITGAITATSGDISGALVAGSITSGHIAASTITTDNIAADTITSADIAADAIQTSELAANSVTASKIVAGTITGDRIAAGTITGDNIQAGTIEASDIQAGSITADRLNVSTLSAISADLGTVTAGTIDGATILAGASNEVTIDSSGIDIDSGSGASNSIKFDGDNVISMFSSFVRITPPSGHGVLITGSGNSIEFQSASYISLDAEARFGSSNILWVSGISNAGYVCIASTGYLFISSVGC